MAITAVKLSEIETLTDDERRALRASRFAAENPGCSDCSTSKSMPRLAHPGGPIATNKAAALAKFLQRKIDAGSVADLNPDLVEQAVKNAEASLTGDSHREVQIKHVAKFDDSQVEWTTSSKKKKRKKEKSKRSSESGGGVGQKRERVQKKHSSKRKRRKS